ncbi:MAG: LytTR family DNA-binding domain-containing protein [Bacteroidota bacterium]
MRSILIDDEPAALAELRYLLERYHPNVSIIGQAQNGHEGLKLTKGFAPDLLFLDIEMPDLNGFDLLRELNTTDRPEIIFVTSKAGYALQAFRVAALSYLVKPVDRFELNRAIKEATKRIKEKSSDKRLNALLENLEVTSVNKKKVGLPFETGMEFVDAGDILFCQGEEGYTRIFLKDGSSRLSSYSIGEYKKMLQGFNFGPVHRSYLVNYQHIRQYEKNGRLHLTNGKVIQVSRRRKPAVDQWLNNQK